MAIDARFRRALMRLPEGHGGKSSFAKLQSDVAQGLQPRAKLAEFRHKWLDAARNWEIASQSAEHGESLPRSTTWESHFWTKARIAASEGGGKEGRRVAANIVKAMRQIPRAVEWDAVRKRRVYAYTDKNKKYAQDLIKKLTEVRVDPEPAAVPEGRGTRARLALTNESPADSVQESAAAGATSTAADQAEEAPCSSAGKRKKRKVRRASAVAETPVAPGRASAVAEAPVAPEPVAAEAVEPQDKVSEQTPRTLPEEKITERKKRKARPASAAAAAPEAAAFEPPAVEAADSLDKVSELEQTLRTLPEAKLTELLPQIEALLSKAREID